MLRPLIHIGYPKTGTSWLQKRLFVDTEIGFTMPVERAQLRDHFVNIYPFDFDPQPIEAFYAQPVGQALAAGHVPVFSEERFSGHHYSGGYDAKEIAERLISVFPNGRVLIVIREQKAMIFSIYKHYVQKGGPSSFTDFVNPPGPPRIPYFNFRHYAYDRLIAYYYQCFGKENVLVLPYEMLPVDQVGYVRRILEFAEVPHPELAAGRTYYMDRVNPSLNGVQMLAQRVMNRYFGKRSSINLHSVLPMPPSLWDASRSALWRGIHVLPPQWNTAVDAHLRQLVAAAVGDRYQDSNAQTCRLIGIDLANYDYDLAKEQENS